jgi:hypothetical protein
MLTDILLALMFVTATFCFHYRGLCTMFALIPRLRPGLEARMLVVIVVAVIPKMNGAANIF